MTPGTEPDLTCPHCAPHPCPPSTQSRELAAGGCPGPRQDFPLTEGAQGQKERSQSSSKTTGVWAPPDMQSERCSEGRHPCHQHLPASCGTDVARDTRPEMCHRWIILISSLLNKRYRPLSDHKNLLFSGFKISHLQTTKGMQI